MTDSNKRKDAPGDIKEKCGGKRSKGGSGGKWQTPHQKIKNEAHRRGGKIEPGDAGIWATCVRDKEGTATEELKVLFDEYAGRFYGDTVDEEDEECSGDMEASIQREVASIGNREGPTKLFTPIYLNLPCVLFFKTRPPVEPVDFVHRICVDAMKQPTNKKHRFVNRLTPITVTGKATEKGLEEVGHMVLRIHFRLAGEEYDQKETVDAEQRNFSYAIRPTIRNHSALKRDIVIELVASMIGSNHRVDLTNPDKVIIVEIYQTVCGMSVVGSDWEALKRFNLAEIHQPTVRVRCKKDSKPMAALVAKADSAANPKMVTTNEAEDEADVKVI